MRPLIARLATLCTMTALVASCAAESYDVVIAGGRVMDPESGLDGVRNVGIRDGRIAIVAEHSLRGARVIDATGLVVAPGFVDLHQHGQLAESYALTVRDGVTSAFELEVGTGDVEQWYADRDAGQLVHYGVSVGHIPVRMAVMGDAGSFLPSGPGGHGVADAGQLTAMEQRIEAGLRAGAVAVGFGTAYTPAATNDEIERMFRVAAAHTASVHVHVRDGVRGLGETIAMARRAAAPLHIVHANSSGDSDIDLFLATIASAQGAGQDVTTEAYPYGAGMTRIESALFDDWRTWSDDQFPIHQWAATGERLTRETFARYRRLGGGVIIHSRTEAMTRAAIASPLTMIASDGFIENGTGHPRTAGTYARVLGRYVRDEGLTSLMDALSRMTLQPARRLEARVPAMRSKGRIREGADADLTVFNPATVIDRATYENPTAPSDGIPFVLVGGTVVVEDGQLVAGVRPGTAIRAPFGQ